MSQQEFKFGRLLVFAFYFRPPHRSSAVCLSMSVLKYELNSESVGLLVLLWSSFLLLDIDMSLLYSSPCISLTHEYLILPVMLRPVCRKCIYEKLTNEEADCCPICDAGLGCTPIEKLRADHNLQEVRDKIFPSREGKVTGSEVIPSALLDSRRKERSLSSLGISTPHSNIQLSLPGRRTKAAARKAAALRGSNFSSQDPIERMEGSLDNSPDTLNDTAEDIIQNLSATGLSDRLVSSKHSEDADEPEKVHLWESGFQDDAANGSEPPDGPSSEVHMPTKEGRERADTLTKVQDGSNGTHQPSPEMVNRKKINRSGRKRGASSKDQGTSIQYVLDSGAAQRRGTGPVWFRLLASEDQEGDAPLPQISKSYMHLKNGDLPISKIQSYLMHKLNLGNLNEVEITYHGQPVSPEVRLNSLIQWWLRTAAPSHRVQTTIGSSAADFVLELHYQRNYQYY
ncbi:hypothetical protein IFM89_005102 [Coptis chinensis]|uniref:E3 ubiquitin protein ligase DRIP2 n=1 Tax=Coptis chinensis TaxID=261450 RepID=A0A835M497_9MAGN|nr:hypothetical protein IFM89_005102 [Coptis chinensis]